METPFSFSGAVEKLARLILPSGDVIEFGTLESALHFVNSARAANVAGADGVTILSFERGEWTQIVEQAFSTPPQPE